ncbi:MAG: hypothetical protein CUN55_06230 [Phototrophicales bacterium]|nr:MAG: hypothetical protein CUN55_06230 [Phototrophicales bacterium]
MLYQSDTDILFPYRSIAALRHLRGPIWQQLVNRICQHQDETHLEVLAFMLLMIRQNNCLQCFPHNYRAMRGCTICAQQVIERSRYTDEELVQMWEAICIELKEYSSASNNPDIHHVR